MEKKEQCSSLQDQWPFFQQRLDSLGPMASPVEKWIRLMESWDTDRGDFRSHSERSNSRLVNAHTISTVIPKDTISKPWKRTTLSLSNTSVNKTLKNYQLCPLSKLSLNMFLKHTMVSVLIFTIKWSPKWRTSWRSSWMVEISSSILGAVTDNTANTFLKECFIWEWSNAGRWLLFKMEHTWTVSTWHSEVTLLIKCFSLRSYITSPLIKPDYRLSSRLAEF